MKGIKPVDADNHVNVKVWILEIVYKSGTKQAVTIQNYFDPREVQRDLLEDELRQFCSHAYVKSGKELYSFNDTHRIAVDFGEVASVAMMLSDWRIVSDQSPEIPQPGAE